MPELPEVETVLQALRPHLVNDKFTEINTYVNKLRSPLILSDVQGLLNQPIENLWRRAKYIVLKLKNGYGLIIHLGMTGSWRLESMSVDRQKHDHAEFYLSSGLVLRYNDPRRFGQIVVFEPDCDLIKHKLFVNLGPEPLTDDFSNLWLKRVCKNKKKPIKSLIMDNKNVVGVGNIYASESLFRSGINPLLAGGAISNIRLKRLTRAIKDILRDAIKAGGTTIKDYSSLNGEEGYFYRELMVYGKAGDTCSKCNRGIIRQAYQSGRSTFYCPVCQR
ncbi:MAG: DNA-formamidopyrimidine glycosylase [Bacteroidetes bacterium]|nr:MAG: DNA-formamidopyrimidine glycosylase [Bacteroidota bacterium]